MSERKIHLRDLEEETLPQKKRWGFAWFFAVIICLGIFFVSPLPPLLFSLIPNSVVKFAVSSAFQNITLDESPSTLNSPKKYQASENLPILGRNSGICFIFDHIDENRKDNARRGIKIAEIIAIGKDKKEYMLDNVTMDEINNEQTSVICQKFSRANTSIMPDFITEIYIRPLKPFTPIKIIWATKKDIYDKGEIK